MGKEQFYERFVTWDSKRTSEEQYFALCPLHNEKTPSFTVNKETGKWYCHGCGQGGHYIEFVELYYDVDREVAVEAVKQWELKKKWIFPLEEEVQNFHEALLKKAPYLDELHSFGITDKIIKELKLGRDDMRITFPVYSKTGQLINIRKYMLPSCRQYLDKAAKVHGIKYCNTPRFYPIDCLMDPEQDEVWICEGEKDMAVARSQGLNAVTSTGRMNKTPLDWDLFKNKTVYIMTDSDEAGEKIAIGYRGKLGPVAKAVYRVKLPLKDFTDFWMEYHTTNLVDFVVDVTEDAKNGRKASKASQEVNKTILLAKSEDIDTIGEWVKLNNMSISGTDPKTFAVPKSLCLRCGHQGGACSTPCMIATAREPEIVEVEPRELMSFVGASDRTQDMYLRKLFGCKQVMAEPHEYVNVQKILFQESASFIDGLEDSTSDHRFGYYLYNTDRLKPTAKYDMEAMRVTDPRSQQNNFVIRKAETAASNLEGLKITESTIEFFKSVAAEHGYDKVIEAHYENWVGDLGIEGRPDLFGLILLTLFSVTEIKWKVGVIKGWLDSMVIGDTRTGKSQMAQRFIKLFGMGSYINGENSRRTGVIGGVQRFDESWVITWGAIPLNDRGMLVIDEASGLDIEDVKELSATRSSGAVSINKIAKGEARARTRLLWLSNPRSGRNLDEFYWKGFGAFQEFIPVAEDQARYDVVISAARDDVDVRTFDDVERTSKLNVKPYQEAAAFAWSVSHENVIITKEAAKAVKAAAIQLDQDYGGGPLVVGVAVHEKILRLGAACAILCGSIEGDRRQVMVTSDHIKMGVDFLIQSFDKPTFDYRTFSREQNRAAMQRKENIEFIKGHLALHPALTVLLSANIFRGNQLKEILGLGTDEASKLLSEFLQRGLVKMTNQGAYTPDKMMIDIVKQIGGGSSEV